MNSIIKFFYDTKNFSKLRKNKYKTILIDTFLNNIETDDLSDFLNMSSIYYPSKEQIKKLANYTETFIWKNNSLPAKNEMLKQILNNFFTNYFSLYPNEYKKINQEAADFLLEFPAMKYDESPIRQLDKLHFSDNILSFSYLFSCKLEPSLISQEQKIALGCHFKEITKTINNNKDYLIKKEQEIIKKREQEKYENQKSRFLFGFEDFFNDYGSKEFNDQRVDKINFILAEQLQHFSFDYQTIIKENITPEKTTKQIISSLDIKYQKQIQDLFSIYLSNINSITNIETKLQFERIFNKIIPETVEQYVSVPDNYKNDFKNQKGLSATDIFESSIAQISDYIKNTIDKINEENAHNHLSELSVKNRYIQSSLK